MCGTARPRSDRRLSFGRGRDHWRSTKKRRSPCVARALAACRVVRVRGIGSARRTAPVKRKGKETVSQRLNTGGRRNQRSNVAVIPDHRTCVQMREVTVPPLVGGVSALTAPMIGSNILCDLTCSGLGLLSNDIRVIRILIRNKHGLSLKSSHAQGHRWDLTTVRCLKKPRRSEVLEAATTRRRAGS